MDKRSLRQAHKNIQTSIHKDRHTKIDKQAIIKAGTQKQMNKQLKNRHTKLDGQTIIKIGTQNLDGQALRKTGTQKIVKNWTSNHKTGTQNQMDKQS